MSLACSDHSHTNLQGVHLVQYQRPSDGLSTVLLLPQLTEIEVPAIP